MARDLFFTGNTVIIDHGSGVFSMLAHLSKVDVAEGQQTHDGDVIGLVGATGRVTGPHLHWALRIGTARVDALSALATLPAATEPSRVVRSHHHARRNRSFHQNPEINPKSEIRILQ